MRKVLVGIVKSDKRANTLRVEIARRMKHPKYGKIIRGTTVCQVHADAGAAKVGDTVEIVECPPVSKTKRWQLVRVVTSANVIEA